MMPFDLKSLDEIQESDLQALVRDSVPESRTIEYKRCLPDRSSGGKKEFLFDVSSFANASGGWLLYGLDEERDVPKEVCGLQVSDPDAEILRLEQMISSGIDPRIPGCRLKTLRLENGRPVVIIRIPRSWAMPHMVTFEETNKFYARRSKGKYLLDVHELRSLFVLSEAIPERIRHFRLERLTSISAGETPVLLEPGPRMVLHVIPFDAFDPRTSVNLLAATELEGKYWDPFNRATGSPRFNFDGVFVAGAGDEGRGCGYIQLFRSGIVEAVDTLVFNEARRSIRSSAFDERIVKGVPNCLRLVAKLGLNVPIAVGLSFMGVKGYCMSRPADAFNGGRPIDRDVLRVPETLLDNFECHPAQLKPLSDSVWNAAGYMGSPNLDATGNLLSR